MTKIKHEYFVEGGPYTFEFPFPLSAESLIEPLLADTSNFINVESLIDLKGSEIMNKHWLLSRQYQEAKELGLEPFIKDLVPYSLVLLNGFAWVKCADADNHDPLAFRTNGQRDTRSKYYLLPIFGGDRFESPQLSFYGDPKLKRFMALYSGFADIIPPEYGVIKPEEATPIDLSQQNDGRWIGADPEWNESLPLFKWPSGTVLLLRKDGVVGHWSHEWEAIEPTGSDPLSAILKDLSTLSLSS